MEFIKDFLNRISHFFKEITRKIKEKLLVIELTNQRNERQAVLNNMYCLIGRAVTENNTINLDHMILNAKQHALDVEELTKQIESITGIVNCRNCGNKIVDDDGFCAYCGEPIPNLETEETPKIEPQKQPEEQPKPKRKPRAKPEEPPKPETTEEPDTKPSEAEKPKRKRTPKPTTEPVQETVLEPKPPRKCHICGAISEEENGRFCAECGAQLRN